MLSTSANASRPRSRRRCERASSIAWHLFASDLCQDISTVSNQNNKSRLQLLSLREELLEESFDEARKGLKSTVNDEGKYQSVLKGLILQVRHSYGLLLVKVLKELLEGSVYLDGEGCQDLVPEQRRIACQQGEGRSSERLQGTGRLRSQALRSGRLAARIVSPCPISSMMQSIKPFLQSWRRDAHRLRWTDQGRQHP